MGWQPGPQAFVITVLTCAVPKRLEWLARATASVRAQTLKPHAHLIHIDYGRSGTVASLNRMLAGVETPYVALLADDDELYPEHLEKLRAAISGHTVAYSWCDCGGQIPHTQDGSTVAATALIRTQAVRDMGGWTVGEREGNSKEDFRLWGRLRSARCTFTCVPEITWKYNFHGDNQSRGGLKEID